MTQPCPRIQRRWHKFIPARVRCEFCDWPFGVEAEDSRTLYEWDGEGEDPNRSVKLCRVCAATHHAHWDDMWNEYWTGLI
jgi:hypothetical protein